MFVTAGLGDKHNQLDGQESERSAQSARLLSRRAAEGWSLGRRANKEEVGQMDGWASRLDLDTPSSL